jgi:hypothetical protein
MGDRNEEIGKVVAELLALMDDLSSNVDVLSGMLHDHDGETGTSA